MLFKRMELILGMKSDLRRSRWPAGNPDNGTDCHAAQKAKLSPTNWIHSRWKGSNHTVAVWVVRPTTGAVVRVVVSTSQIFLGETDRFDTKKFDRGVRKPSTNTHAATSRTLMSFPCPLFEYFLRQVDKYGALPTRGCNNCGICAKASFCERRRRNRQLARP